MLCNISDLREVAHWPHLDNKMIKLYRFNKTYWKETFVKLIGLQYLLQGMHYSLLHRVQQSEILTCQAVKFVFNRKIKSLILTNSSLRSQESYYRSMRKILPSSTSQNIRFIFVRKSFQHLSLYIILAESTVQSK